MKSLWSYHPDIDIPHDSIIGYDVEAIDGSIGSVDEAQHDSDDAYLIVDTGHWIFGKRRIIPARVVNQINTDRRTIFLSVTRDHIADAPDFGADRGPAMREEVSAHFAAL